MDSAGDDLPKSLLWNGPQDSIRHPSFQGVREDKSPKAIGREHSAADPQKTRVKAKHSR